MADALTIQGLSGTPKTNPEPSQAAGGPLATLVQLRQLQSDHAMLSHHHEAFRARATGHIQKLEARNRQLEQQKQRLEASNAELTASLNTATSAEKEQRLQVQELGRAIEEAQRDRTNSSLQQFGVGVQLEHAEQRARRAEASERELRKQLETANRQCEENSASLKRACAERERAFSLTLKRASNSSTGTTEDSLGRGWADDVAAGDIPDDGDIPTDVATAYDAEGSEGDDRELQGGPDEETAAAAVASGAPPFNRKDAPQHTSPEPQPQMHMQPLERPTSGATPASSGTPTPRPAQSYLFGSRSSSDRSLV